MAWHKERDINQRFVRFQIAYSSIETKAWWNDEPSCQCICRQRPLLRMNRRNSRRRSFVCLDFTSGDDDDVILSIEILCRFLFLNHYQFISLSKKGYHSDESDWDLLAALSATISFKTSIDRSIHCKCQWVTIWFKVIHFRNSKCA